MMKKQWSTVLVIILILLVAFFSVLNVDPVNINFGFTLLEMPLVVVIIGTLLIGVLIAVIWSTSIILRERNQQKKLQRRLDESDNKARQEQNELKQKHQEEIQVLKADIEKEQNEIRDLNRRIQNMRTSHSAQGNKHTDGNNV